MISKEEIERMIKRGNKDKYSHVIICQDSFDYDYYPVFVSYEENVREVISQYNDFRKMSKVMEVYNYNLNIDTQLKEHRAYHIEPLIKKEENKKNSKTELALDYATKKHKGQKRLDGKSYITHPLEVANNITKYKKSKNIENLICAAYLHDTLEDTDTTYYDLVNTFGTDIASLVLELTTDEDLKKELGKTKYLKIKMKNMTSWALVIKLCDRLSNVNDLTNCNEEFKNKYIIETIEIIDYLINNRKLSNTHIILIKEIIEKINKLVNITNIDLNNLKKKIKNLNTTYTH